MDNERVILGLDVGIGSIGWGLVKLKEEKYPVEKPDGTTGEKYKITDGEIIDTGIRTFALPQDREGKSLAAKRGQARRIRWTIRRKARRLKQLIKLAKEYKIIGSDFNRNEFFKLKEGDDKEKWNNWRFRKEALERKLTDEEFFRVLYHIAKHRGFFFHTKAEFQIDGKEKGIRGNKEEKETSERDREDEKVKQGLRRIQKLLKESGYTTVGEMFWKIYSDEKTHNKRIRNAEGKYENSIYRPLLRDEIEEIFKAQQRFGNTKAKNELKERYIKDILMKEEPIDEDKLRKMMRQCEFIPDKECAPKESYTAERFTSFNQINTLELIDTKNKGRIALDKEQREKIEALAYKNAKVTYSQIRDELGLGDKLHIRFNRNIYTEKNPEYDKKLKCEVEEGKLQFDENHQITINTDTGEIILDREIKNLFQKRFRPNYNHVTLYYSDIRRELENSEDFKIKDFRFKKFQKEYTKSEKELKSKAEYIKQFEDETFIELKGYHKIRKAIEKNCGEEKWRQISSDREKCGEMIDMIARAMTYCKSDETRTKDLKDNGITDQGVIDAVLSINMSGLANFSKEAMSNLLKYMDKERMLFNDAKKKCGYGKIEYKKQAKLEPYSGFFEKNPVVARVISQTRKLVNAVMAKYNRQTPIDHIHIEIAKDLANSEERKAEISRGQDRYKKAKEAAIEECRKKGLDPEEGQNLLMFRLAEEQNYFCPYSGKKITTYSTGAANEIYIGDCEIDHIIPMSRSFNDSMNNKVLCSPKANQEKQDRIPYEWFDVQYGKDSQEWSNFENTIKKKYGMPYPKRKNLVRKSWTEEDKEKFLSRNLNDTRYAARHIADYLRKYFDFSVSEREDIKEVSRIKVRSGGITAFLRYMWGLSKDREENDLHHAIDALVVACSTDGHVYWISNLSKATERKEKNWVEHYKSIKSKFKPWPSVREDIQNKIDKVFVSRMPRHKVTGGAHKDTISSLKEMPSNKRVIKVNKGYADIGEMVRADIFTDDNGKNYVVPIYATDFFANRPLPDKYVPDDRLMPYEEWPNVVDKTLKFKYSLFKDDLISINGTMYYVSFFEATTTNVNVKNINGSIFIDKKDAQDPYTKKITYRPKKGKCILKKYSIDMLGNYKEIEQEKRVGNIFENGTKRGP